jgi:hypothetical protein
MVSQPLPSQQGWFFVYCYRPGIVFYRLIKPEGFKTTLMGFANGYWQQ